MNDLQRKIDVYFRQHPDRRLLFFFDPYNKYTDDVAGLSGGTFEVLTLSAPYPFFGLKVQLESRPTEASPVLLYCAGLASPRTQAERHVFALLDLLVANDELRLDPVADFMARYGLQPHQRELVDRYSGELINRKDISGLLQPLLRPETFEETALQHTLTARLLGFKTLPDTNTLLAKLLTDRADRPTEQANYLTRLEQLSLDAPLRRRIADLFADGPLTDALTSGFVQQMVLRLKYNLMVGHLPAEGEPYPTLRLHRTDTQSRLHVLRDAIDATRPGMLERLLTTVGEAVREDRLMAHYGPEARYGLYTPQLRTLLLQHLLQSVGPTAVPTSTQLDTLDKLALGLSDVHPQYLLISTVRHGLNLLMVIGGISTYRLDTPEDYIRQYEQEFYRIDMLYRWFVQTRNDWQTATVDAASADIGTPDDADPDWLPTFDQLVHDRYDRFLLELNREWLTCLGERQYNLRSINVPKQYDFYRQAVARPHLRDTVQKVAVIIADGLRYEVARDLQTELNQDAKNQATVGSMLTSLPSTTRFGMANLLPHSDLQFDGHSVSINGQRTEGIEARNAILQAANPRSQAIKFSDLKEMIGRRSTVRELFKSEVVYVYQNRIDEVGDKRETESETIKAVRETIDELKRLIKQLHSQYNVARVLVTADHGFVYQHTAPAELALVKAPDAHPVLENNRYVLTTTTSPTTTGHSLPLANVSALIPANGIHYQLLVPEGVNRYRRQGSGTRYVHGGASLQEVLVPLLESSRKREEVGHKVIVRLVRDGLSLLANQVKVLLLQEQPVTDTDRARTVAVGLYVGNDLASNRVELLFDSVAESPTGRTRECTLHLTGTLPAQRQYTLRISDVTDELNPLLERPVSNKTIIERDF